MTISELNERISKINPSWFITYLEKVNYLATNYPDESEHWIEIVVYNRTSGGDKNRVLEAGINRYGEPYVYLTDYYAKGSRLKNVMELMEFLSDYLEKFKGYVEE